MPQQELNSGLKEFEKLRGFAKKIGDSVRFGEVDLYEECEQMVIHRDVKAGSALLDCEMNARLGDFGLAKLYDRGENPNTTRVVGTLGYLAPELTRTGKPTKRYDVFAFGALLLEVVCGRRNRIFCIRYRRSVMTWTVGFGFWMAGCIDFADYWFLDGRFDFADCMVFD
ncbi:unnamed protein product [Vicia faba]|uniref:Protein kinase domain-containing protein n=1 Tax=Vicia faba TaxID=3906 RepID=A0AAV1AWQ6_VICFA|nr:unnamed protein product [Vicia faba]